MGLSRFGLAMSFAALAHAGGTARMLLHSHNVPSTGQPWTSLTDGTEFQPASPSENAHAVRRAQQRYFGFGSGSQLPYVDGSETYYDDYAQAWRLLGFYIDCNVNQQQDDGGSGYGCQRYLLWAAVSCCRLKLRTTIKSLLTLSLQYIDLHYSGGGIGEYQYWDPKTHSWDSTACEVSGSSRCAKMDCHLTNTHFELLGYFKEPSYYDWMEQLFKHQGVCLWDSDEYQFMQFEREAWPLACTQSASSDENGNTIYFDLKPRSGGGMEIGLYTDYRCSVDYLGRELNAESVIYAYYTANGGDGDDQQQDNGGDDGGEYYDNVYGLSQNIDKWNEAFDIFHYCHPCKTYNLTYEPTDGYSSQNDGDQEYDSYATEHFTCYDDADYTNVNQW